MRGAASGDAGETEAVFVPELDYPDSCRIYTQDCPTGEMRVPYVGGEFGVGRLEVRTAA